MLKNPKQVIEEIRKESKDLRTKVLKLDKFTQNKNNMDSLEEDVKIPLLMQMYSMTCYYYTLKLREKAMCKKEGLLKKIDCVTDKKNKSK
mgnify:CR=1 FL=1